MFNGVRKAPERVIDGGRIMKRSGTFQTLNTPDGQGQKKNRYVWVIFSVSFLMIFTALGYGSSTKGTFLTAVTGSLGLKRSLFTIADSIRYVTTSVMSFFLGRTVEKLGLRKMAGFGFGFLVLSFTLNSVANDYWMFYIGGALLGAGLCWTGTTMIGYLVENWFAGAKGTVMGFLMAANGLGGFSSEFIVTRIIYGADGSLSYELSRWRLAYRIIALIFAAVGIISVLLIRGAPSEMGLEPAGGNTARKKRRGADSEGFELPQILRKPYFYISAVCVFFTGFVLQAMTNISKPYMYDLGFDKNYVVVIFASHALLLMLSKTLAGIGYDTIGMRLTFLACCLCALVSLGSLSLLSAASAVPAWIYSIVSSFAMPLETVMIPLLVSFMFGRQSYKKVFGYYMSFNTLGYACGIPLANLAYDIQGTYKYMIIALAVLMFIITAVQQLSMSCARRDLRRSPQNE